MVTLSALLLLCVFLVFVAIVGLLWYSLLTKRFYPNLVILILHALDFKKMWSYTSPILLFNTFGFILRLAHVWLVSWVYKDATWLAESIKTPPVYVQNKAADLLSSKWLTIITILTKKLQLFKEMRWKIIGGGNFLVAGGLASHISG